MAPSPWEVMIREFEPGDETAPVSSLRSHLSSEPGSDSATPDAGKPAGPKARKRRKHTDNAKPHA